jgi:hypothetical protein
MEEMISKKKAIDAVCLEGCGMCAEVIEDIPAEGANIIHCNACKHWKQTTGKMRGFGLGECDFFGIKLVTCEGFCYWAERREYEQYSVR